ncbi:MAG: hypothetical protein EBR71_11590, partial [Planctomycetes bacterium]|nr:hypothetical protein [Planctomycetota bacterium]
MGWMPIPLPKKLRRERRMANLHLPPGTLQVDPDATRPALTAFGFSPAGFEEMSLKNPEEIRDLIARWPVVWLNVDGLGDEAILRSIQAIFGIHPLAMEDVTDTTQRAKVEQYADNTFLVVPMPKTHGDVTRFESEQLSMYLTERAVISFQA